MKRITQLRIKTKGGINMSVAIDGTKADLAEAGNVLVILNRDNEVFRICVDDITELEIKYEQEAK